MCILRTPRPMCWSWYQPTLNRCIGQRIAQVSTNMLVDISVKCRSTKMCRSYIDRHIGRHLANLSADMLVDMSTKSGCSIVGWHVNQSAIDISLILHCYLRIGCCNLRRRPNLTGRLVTSVEQRKYLWSTRTRLKYPSMATSCSGIVKQ